MKFRITVDNNNESLLNYTMHTKKRANNEITKDIFEHLVNNGFDFLDKALENIDENPKYALIFFCSSIELFFKARLLKEHWTLIVSQKQEPKLTNLLKGDFQSVTLFESIKRLENVLNIKISDNVVQVFRRVSNDRNKVIHFYHEGISNKVLKEKIVKDILLAWYHLHQLFFTGLNKTFASWNKESRAIESKLRKLKKYLEAVYKAEKSTIEEFKRAGAIFNKCPSCDYKTLSYTDFYSNSGFEAGYANCLICGYHENVVNFTCPECNNRIIYEAGDKREKCNKCNKIFSKEELFNLVDVGMSDDPHISVEDGNCHICGGFHSIINTESEYICKECLEYFDELSICDYCGEYFSGDSEFTYIHGCSICEGKYGNEY